MVHSWNPCSRMCSLPASAAAAAGAAILLEAGGVLLDPSGGPWDVGSRRVLGTNAHLGPSVAQLLSCSKTSSEEPAALECGALL